MRNKKQTTSKKREKSVLEIRFSRDGAIIGLWRGVSKGVEDGIRPLALWWATPETAVRPFPGRLAHRA
jgi:hypothetical protein